MATRNAATPSYNDVNNAVNGIGTMSSGTSYSTPAADGDTVIVPANPGNPADWNTATLNVNANITLQGQTTISGDHTTTMTANDQTIIIDNVPTSPFPAVGRIILFTTTAGTTKPRLTGFTFTKGSKAGQNSSGSIAFGGTSHSIRIDHCHFNDLLSQNIFPFDWVYGVVDHNIFTFISGSGQATCYTQAQAYGGGTQGDKAFSDGPQFGTDQFLFWEDNFFNNTTSTDTIGALDGTGGQRTVVRYNKFVNCFFGGHGTEGVGRGTRAQEQYNNNFQWNFGASGGNQRSGTILSHDNTWSGTGGAGTQVKTLNCFRSFTEFNPWWGGAGGNNDWDINDVRNAPYSSGGFSYNPVNGLYDSGTYSQPGISGATTLQDTTKSWATNQWVGFTLYNTVSKKIGSIVSNTSNAITYNLYSPLTFNSGDGYEIHKLFLPLDAPGRGQGDVVVRVSNLPVNQTAGGIVAWPHQALEPCYSWNDKYGPTGATQKFGIGGFNPPGLWLENRDYYNGVGGPGNGTVGVGVGTHAQRPATCTTGVDIGGGTSHPGVGYWETDTNTLFVATATNTWTQYYQPYTYPHPRVGALAAPVFTSAPTAKFILGSPNSFTVSVSSNPTATITVGGTFPSGVMFVDNANGTGTISGTPATGTSGNYSLTFNATNSQGAATQPFTLTVGNTPVFTSATSSSFSVGIFGSFTVTVTSSPSGANIVKTTGSLPSGVTFVDNNNNTATLSGTPATGSAQSYPLLFTATNTIGSTSQNFTLTVTGIGTPVINSSLTASGTVSQSFSYQISATSNPTSYNATGLPGGLSVNTSTGLITGTPTIAGTSNVTISATNSGGTGSATLVITIASSGGGGGGGLALPSAPKNVMVIARSL